MALLLVRLNYGVGTFIEYELNTIIPTSSGMHCIIQCTLYIDCRYFFYSNWLFKFSVYSQIAGHFAGTMLHFLIMGSLSYYLENYVEGYIGWDFWKDHLVLVCGRRVCISMTSISLRGGSM